MHKFTPAKKFKNINIALISFMFSSFFIFDMSSASSSSIVVVFSVILFVYCIENRGIIRFSISQFHLHVFLFALYCVISSLWSWDSSESLSRGITIIEILACLSIVYMFYQYTESVEDVLKAIMWSSIIICIYTVSFYGLETFISMTNQSTRLGNDFANANAIGMWMAVSTVVHVFFIINKPRKKYFITIIIPIVFIGLCQSRTALIESLIGVLVLVVLKSFSEPSFDRSILRAIFLTIAFALILFGLSQLKIFGGLSNRVIEWINGTQKDGASISQRTGYIEIGFNQFLKAPLFGIGIGASRILTSITVGRTTYLHNNYIEMLACGGIVGFLVFYSMHFFLIRNLWRQAKRKIPNSDICFAIIVMHTFADYGTVSYYKKYFYVILVLCFLQVHIGNRTSYYLNRKEFSVSRL